jgi:hypothetical protein
MTKDSTSPTGPTRAQLNAQLNRALLSAGDFGEARDCLRYFQTLDLSATDVVVQRALLTAAVIAYCRPFSGNEAHDMATEQVAVKLKALFSDEQWVLHGELNALRNEAVAHSDYDRRPVGRTHGSLTGFSIWGENFDLLREGLDVAKWEQMCERLAGECFRRAMAINRQLTLLEEPSLKALLPSIPDGGSGHR